MDPRIRLTRELLDSLSSTASSGQTQPAPAASVVMLRDSSAGPEVLLQVRAASMAFAGGRPVFPGGRVDPGDAEPAPAWVGPTPDRWAADLGVEPGDARAVVHAAIRETFEESGYLLASHADGSPLVDLDTDEWRQDREELSQHRISLSDLLGRRTLSVRSDWLKAWSLWVTPDFEPRRFHTWFLVARCPISQRILGVSRESTTRRWITADQALRQADADRLRLLPPQYCTFLELYGHRSVHDIFGYDRTIRDVRPTMATDDRGQYLSLPNDLVELGVRTGDQMYRTSKESS